MRYQEWTQRIERIIQLFYIECRKFKLKAWTTCMFAAAWWGVLYPELCFTEETFQAVIVAEKEAVGEQPEEQGTREQTGEGKPAQQKDTLQSVIRNEELQQNEKQQITYQDILEATGDDVVIKSRFLEWLEEYIK